MILSCIYDIKEV